MLKAPEPVVAKCRVVCAILILKKVNAKAKTNTLYLVNNFIATGENVSKMLADAVDGKNPVVYIILAGAISLHQKQYVSLVITHHQKNVIL